MNGFSVRRGARGMGLALAALLTLGAQFPMAQAIEKPQYTVVQRYGGFEVREYAPYLVAEVTVTGPQEQAGNRGFRILAAYIFGRNRGERRIAMTAPVTQQSAAVKIAMTAPVTESAVEGGYLVRFMMPRKFTRETLPQPLDERIRFKEVEGGRFAVIRYSGTWSARNYRAHLMRLENAVKGAGLTMTGPPIYARYNPPFVPWFLRRNEIWLRLK